MSRVIIAMIISGLMAGFGGITYNKQATNEDEVEKVVSVNQAKED